MLRQQQSEGELIRLYRSLIGLIIIAILLGALAYRYFGGINQAMVQGTDLTYNRFLNVLVVVRSQWLAFGKPKSMELDWQVFDSTVQANSRVRMSVKGRPLPKQFDDSGCQLLFHQLMGESVAQQFEARYQFDVQTCRYVSKSQDSISYQLSSGRVLYIPRNKI